MVRPFQITASGKLKTSIANEKLPINGLEGEAHEVILTLCLVLVFVVTFMEVKNLLDGFLKLSHMIFPEEGSSKTRLPESKIRAIESVLVVVEEDEEMFEDQRTVSF